MTDLNTAHITEYKNNVVYLEALIASPKPGPIDEDCALAVYEAVVAIKQKIEAQKIFLDEGIEILKRYMGNSEILVSSDGKRLATWVPQEPRLAFKVDLLKKNFPLEYELCCEKEEEGRRPFCLK